MFVITTVPSKEDIAKWQLEKLGFRVYAPRQEKTRKSKGIVIKTYEKLLFPSYLFIDLNNLSDKDYYKIKETVYVNKFLGNLKDSEEEYIRFLANNGKALPIIKIYFDKNGKARIENDIIDISSRIASINSRDKKLRVKIELSNEEKIVILNYEEINIA